jgi:radical SAM superfamily enzyme YgiQ (UPF0313 family)
MDKVALINTPVRLLADASFFPIGLAYIGTMLQRAGRDVEVLDFNLERPSLEGASQRIRETKAKYYCVTGMAIQFGLMREYAKMVKQHHPDAIVIAGGRACAVPELVLRVPEIDYCGIHDGEETIIELLDALDSGKDPIELDIRGLAARREGKMVQTSERAFQQDLDVYGAPNYDLFDVEQYIHNQMQTHAHRGSHGDLRSLNMIATRGCPFACSFCGEDVDALRRRGLKSLFEEIDYLVDRYKIEHIHFSDGLFVNSRRRTIEFCEEYDRRKERFSWSGNARVDIITEDLMKRMMSSGCNHVAYGFESGSPAMMKAMNKTTTVEQNARVVELHKKLNIHLSSSLIFGARGETYATMWETAQFAMAHRFTPSAINFMMIYPGTEDWKYALRMGVIKDGGAYLDEIASYILTGYAELLPLVNMTAMPLLPYYLWGRTLQAAIGVHNFAMEAVEKTPKYLERNGAKRTAEKLAQYGAAYMSPRRIKSAASSLAAVGQAAASAAFKKIPRLSKEKLAEQPAQTCATSNGEHAQQPQEETFVQLRRRRKQNALSNSPTPPRSTSSTTAMN